MDIIALIIGISFIVISASVFNNIDEKSHQKSRLSIFKNLNYESKKRLFKVLGSLELVCGILLIILALF
jgi:hypothetical protein